MDGWLDRERVVVEFGAHVNFLGDWRMSMEGAPLLWKEPISRAAVLGVGVGVLAVILVVQ